MYYPVENYTEAEFGWKLVDGNEFQISVSLLVNKFFQNQTKLKMKINQIIKSLKMMKLIPQMIMNMKILTGQFPDFT